jgi:hypothetical protein
MRKSKEPSGSENRARTPREEPEARQGRNAEDECCALLRADPIAAPASAPRRRRAHENGGDKRP